jgi:hypothetical protein
VSLYGNTGVDFGARRPYGGGVDPTARLIGEREIERLPSVYALAVDVGDWQTVRSVFEDSCEIEGSLGTAAIDDYVPRIREFCGQFAAVMHNVTTCVVVLEDEDRARLDSFSLALYVDPLDGGPTRAAGAHYMDEVRRGPDGWKIAARRVSFPWRFDPSP